MCQNAYNKVLGVCLFVCFTAELFNTVCIFCSSTVWSSVGSNKHSIWNFSTYKSCNWNWSCSNFYKIAQFRTWRCTGAGNCFLAVFYYYKIHLGMSSLPSSFFSFNSGKEILSPIDLLYHWFGSRKTEILIQCFISLTIPQHLPIFPSSYKPVLFLFFMLFNNLRKAPHFFCAMCRRTESKTA